jgi:Amidase
MFCAASNCCGSQSADLVDVRESRQPDARREPTIENTCGACQQAGVTHMLTATDLAQAVRAGDLDPVTVTESALTKIASGDEAIGAFRRVRTREAIAEARALQQRPDLGDLALAGVPIAIKDVTAVAGEYVG